jgi:outer membrane protein TolC
MSALSKVEAPAGPADLDAQRELYANEEPLAQSRTAQAVDLIALYKALGGGWQTFSQP